MNFQPSRSVYPLTTTEKINFTAIPAWVAATAEHLIQHGFQVVLVGGAVRDLITGRSPQDWDLATDALPDQVEALFPATVPTGKQYGTITVIAADESLEVTTFREDVSYSDGRRPDAIRFSKDVITDLARRDFTINAMAYDFKTARLIDPFGGKRDLFRGKLKAVGEPKLRFAEDGLRMFRFFRFVATLDLQPDRTALKAVNPAWAAPVSPERIAAELGKLLTGTQAAKALHGLQASGLLSLAIPELAIAQLALGDSPRKSLWNHLTTTVAAIQPRLDLRWAALLHDIAKPATKTAGPDGLHYLGHDTQGAEIAQLVLERLRYPKTLINPVVLLVRHHMFAIPFPFTDGAIRRLIAKVGETGIHDLLELRRADIVASGNVSRQTWEHWQALNQSVTEYLNSTAFQSSQQLAINGTDLMQELGLAPGPAIGNLLRTLQEQIWENPGLNQKETLLSLARDLMNQS